MAVPSNEDDGILQEWAPLSGLLREVPLSVRQGLFLETVNLTCIDALPEYLAVGTNIGVVYWYHRENHNMQRLRPEKKHQGITCVKVVSSVDYMVAAGDESGTVTIFRIPKPTPDWISPAYKQNSSSNVERYTVGGLHSAPVTALEWSLNGQKLFSGDATGLVVLTEIDFYMNLSKACEILNEKYRVVQLSFHKGSQTLVVATEYRCILAHRQQDAVTWTVVQVGQKERRNLCRVGAVFFPHPERAVERIIYSGRPGMRFWQADMEGTVHNTLIFKEALRQPHQKIQLLSAPPLPTSKESLETEFSPVYVWRNSYLVSINSSSLVVLDPKHTSVVASLSQLTDLHALTVTNDEIFIIYGSRNIVRLSYVPDVYSGKVEESGISFLESKVSPVTDTLLDITSKIKSKATHFVQSRPINAVNGTKEEELATGTDALEFDLPPMLPVDDSIQELNVGLDHRIQVLHQIGKQSFDEVLHSSTRKVKAKSLKPMRNSKSYCETGLENSSENLSVRSDESTEESEPNSRPPSRNNNPPPQPSQIDLTHPSSAQPRLSLDLVSSSNHISGQIPPDILPDLRSPDSILRDVHDKEILVAKAFNLEEILLADPKAEESQEANKSSKANNEEVNDERDNSLGYGPPSGSSSAIPSLEPPNPDNATNSSLNYKLNLRHVDSCVASEKPPEKLSNFGVMKKPDLYEEIEINHPLAGACGPLTPDKSVEDSCEGWEQVMSPESCQYLSVSKDYVCVSGPSRAIHKQSIHKLTDTEVIHKGWERQDYKAQYVAVSPNGQIWWKLDFGIASALVDVDSSGSRWEIAARGVESIALTDMCAWYVSAGQLYLMSELCKNVPYRDSCHIPCPSPVVKVCCSSQAVWVVTSSYDVLWRVGLTDQCLEGTHWQRVQYPSHLQVADIAVGPFNTGWLIDRANDLYYSDDYFKEDSCWWQVLVSDYLYENSSLCYVASNENSVWVTNRISPFTFANSSSVLGHRWVNKSLKNLTVSLRWRQITAQGVFEDKGSLWLLSSSNDLFHLRPDSDIISVVALPCRAEDVSGLSASSHALWLLTVLGQIHVRQGMSDQTPQGEKWRTLNTEQISDKQVTLCHVSCGCDVIWACDTKGDMYMAVGSPYLIATDTFSPAWVPVDGRPLPATHFVKVFVGSETHVVWALDNKHNVYVRSGIFHDFQLGTDWVLVPGLQASTLTISGSTVWALSLDGSVFCRKGISQNNYIGNFWQRVPGHLNHLTASVSGGLWGVCSSSGRLVQYFRYSLPLSLQAKQAALTATLADDDWEVIYNT